MKTKNYNRIFLSEKKLSRIDDVRRSLKLLILSALLFTASGIFSGCKKSNDKKPTCRIIAASIPSSGVVFNFLYNNNGKLSRISTAFGTASFDYPADNTVIVTTQASDTFQSRKIIKVNAAGLATNVRIENNTAGTQFTNDAFEYTGNELAKQTSTSSFDPNPRITTYTWFNGNMVSIASGGAITESREYFTDKPRQDGDFFTFNQFIQGFEIVRTKNLVKSTSQSGLNFTYEFGADGNISSVKATFSSGVSAFQDYQYECK